MRADVAQRAGVARGAGGGSARRAHVKPCNIEGAAVHWEIEGGRGLGFKSARVLNCLDTFSSVVLITKKLCAGGKNPGRGRSIQRRDMHAQALTLRWWSIALHRLDELVCAHHAGPARHAGLGVPSRPTMIDSTTQDHVWHCVLHHTYLHFNVCIGGEIPFNIEESPPCLPFREQARNLSPRSRPSCRPGRSTRGGTQKCCMCYPRRYRPCGRRWA